MFFAVLIAIYMFFGFVAYWKKNGSKEGLKLLGVYIASGIVFYALHWVAMDCLFSLWFFSGGRMFSGVWLFAIDGILFFLLTIAWSRILDWGRPLLRRLGIELASE